MHRLQCDKIHIVHYKEKWVLIRQGIRMYTKEYKNTIGNNSDNDNETDNNDNSRRRVSLVLRFLCLMLGRASGQATYSKGTVLGVSKA